MNKLMLRTVGLAAFLGITVAAWAHEEKTFPAKSGSPEFQQLKQLVGKWQGTSNSKDPQEKAAPISTEFRLTAAGSAVEETLMKGTPHEMVDMYADENGRLAMKHYCAIGNQPHMVAKHGAGAHTIQLEMTSTPGIAATDMHMHALTLEFPDADHLTERWTNYANGKPGETVVFTLARVK